MFFSFSVMAYTDENTLFEVHDLLLSGLTKNFDEIHGKTALLSPSEKLFLFDIHSKNSGVPFAVNLIAGFGIGSYIQGDITSGTIQLSGQLLSLAGLIAGSLLMTPDIAESPYEEGYGTKKATDIGSAFIITGLVLFYGTRIYGCISPFVFKNVYNRKLKNALHYYSLSYNITPSFDTKGNGNVTAMMSFKF
jgi:hypothetical protein